ncbi:helix-turn-helix transcriptional regulator [Oscillibacter sp.]|nr:AraC family transcriptional regulator [Oscillibacter sp.]
MEKHMSKADRENLYVHQALEYIRNNYSNGITVGDVANYVVLNRSYLFTLFQRVLGVSPQEYLSQFRLTRAKEQLTLTNSSVASIAQSCGYQDPQVFSKAFKQLFGTTPVKYRKLDRENARRSLESHLAGTAEYTGTGP